MSAANQLHQLMMADHTDEKLQINRRNLDIYRSQGLNSKPVHESGTDEMRILSTGDVTVSAPPSAPQSQGLGKVLAGAALGAALLGIPGAGLAGFALNALINRPQPTAPAPVPAKPTSDESLDIGLKRFTDLVP